MGLTVVNVAYALGTVGSVGGAEQVLAAIDRALVAAGARSIVVACEGSRVRGTLCATPRVRGVIDDGARAAAWAAQARAIEAVLNTHTVDVLHFHGVDFHSYMPGAGVPALATLHLPPSWYPESAIAPTRPETYVHCVSESQHRVCPPSPAVLPPIPNGVRIPARHRRRRGRRGVVALGRICPEKGFHLALDAARRARVALTLAGRVFPYPAHLAYWANEIAPRLDQRRRFIGAVGPAKRNALLQSARCLVVPSLVAETSSLVAMEALASGTPVVAFASGALSEIVEHGITGYLVHDEREMADAIRAVDAIDPDACRAAAEARFSVDAMTTRYLHRYETLATTRARPDRARRDAPGSARRLPVRITRSEHSGLDVSTVRTAGELEQIAGEWRTLASQVGTPLQQPEWLLPWWRHFGAGGLRAVAVRRGGELVGFAPLYLRPAADGTCELAMIGTGNTDYVDVLARPDVRRDVAARVLDHIVRTSDAWRCADLGPLPATSPLLEFPAPGGWRVTTAVAGVCPVLALAPGGEVEDSVRGHFVHRLRARGRRIARDHEVTIEEATPATAVALFDEFAALHDARWTEKGEQGVLHDPAVRAFHHDVVDGMARAGLLRLFMMRADGAPVAGVYGFADQRRFYSYLGGFDPAFARFGVQSLVILHAVERAIRDGLREFDFLRGQEPYKYRWGATDRAVHTWSLCR